jgi:3-phenylpropionate/trans-cinnamate dioxygenase ferredoxin subunit
MSDADTNTAAAGAAALALLPLADLPEGRGRRVCRAGYDLALFRFGDVVYAIDDSCPHAGASLSSGRVEGRRVVCRAHGLKFGLVGGRADAAPTLEPRRHCVRTVDGVVMLFPQG